MATVSSIQSSGADTSAFVRQTQSSNAGRAKPTSQPPPSTLKDDSVKLSMAANIKLMHHEGLSPTIIASQLGISVKQVNSYIPGITQAAAAASVSVAAPSAHSQRAVSFSRRV